MKIPQLITAEFRRLTATRMSRIALVALLAVPVLYGGLYLWANQDPYAKFPEVPVALVVDDVGTPDADATDGVRNVGEEVADELVADGAFDWHVVSDAEAADGLDHSRYDFSVTIPQDFSEALASVSTDAPRQAQLVLSTSDANSYLATTIGTQAVERIRAAVAQQVNREAADTLLTSISEIRSGLVEASDGAGRLADGAVSAVDGSAQLATGSAALADGTAALAAGSAQLADGSARLVDGTAQLAAGASDLDAGAAQVADGNAQLAASADQVGDAVADAAARVPEARQAIAEELAARGVDQATIDAVLAKLDPLADRVADGNGRVQEVVGKIDALADGSRQVADGASRLAAGTSEAAAGASDLATGAAQLADGASTAAAGAVQLRDGSAALATGLGELATGADDLHGALTDGAERIPDTDAATRAAQAATIADPVDLETSAVTAAGSYGAGLAPFFAALAGWIGIYALFLIVKPVSRRAVTALHSPVRVTLAGWLTPAVLGAVQMVALFLVLAGALGFRIAHPSMAVGVLLLASATYAAIILALNVWLGSVGQFIGLVLMVMQLVTAGGTFPWQTLPAPLAWLHHVLPMGYVVDAMRQVMYDGDLARAGGDALVLIGWLAAALVVAAIGVTRMTHFRTVRDLQPSLIG
ncbi:YhgE/Pip domain-containing protein [Agromyces larvae]|uniref:YhgE/Pip domain-containing protein n=1 Tax=Agromyces larvae TaxID=2929802 RepID=A0ABY4BVC0_9MICO|nr:YhgE/Pip domain-containing protein [Agromyces larvae]UOE43110.1 YhgE/Pip domain-containing protein [Agromyces larvae]